MTRSDSSDISDDHIYRSRSRNSKSAKKSSILDEKFKKKASSIIDNGMVKLFSRGTIPMTKHGKQDTKDAKQTKEPHIETVARGNSARFNDFNSFSSGYIFSTKETQNENGRGKAPEPQPQPHSVVISSGIIHMGKEKTLTKHHRSAALVSSGNIHMVNTSQSNLKSRPGKESSSNCIGGAEKYAIDKGADKDTLKVIDMSRVLEKSAQNQTQIESQIESQIEREIETDKVAELGADIESEKQVDTRTESVPAMKINIEADKDSKKVLKKDLEKFTEKDNDSKKHKDTDSEKDKDTDAEPDANEDAVDVEVEMDSVMATATKNKLSQEIEKPQESTPAIAVRSFLNSLVDITKRMNVGDRINNTSSLLGYHTFPSKNTADTDIAVHDASDILAKPEETKLTDTDDESFHDDVCCVCEYGGELLVCDFCPSAIHLECNSPPLDQIPEGEYACPKCSRRSSTTTLRPSFSPQEPATEQKKKTGRPRKNPDRAAHPLIAIPTLAKAPASLLSPSSTDDDRSTRPKRRGRKPRKTGVIRRKAGPKKRAINNDVPDSDDSFYKELVVSEDAVSDHDEFCMICHNGDNTLLCCDFCQHTIHLKCNTPPLTSIPEGDYACPECVQLQRCYRVEKILSYRIREKRTSLLPQSSQITSQDSPESTNLVGDISKQKMVPITNKATKSEPDDLSMDPTTNFISSSKVSPKKDSSKLTSLQAQQHQNAVITSSNAKPVLENEVMTENNLQNQSQKEEISVLKVEMINGNESNFQFQKEHISTKSQKEELSKPESMFRDQSQGQDLFDGIEKHDITRRQDKKKGMTITQYEPDNQPEGAGILLRPDKNRSDLLPSTPSILAHAEENMGNIEHKSSDDDNNNDNSDNNKNDKSTNNNIENVNNINMQSTRNDVENKPNNNSSDNIDVVAERISSYESNRNINRDDKLQKEEASQMDARGLNEPTGVDAFNPSMVNPNNDIGRRNKSFVGEAKKEHTESVHEDQMVSSKNPIKIVVLSGRNKSKALLNERNHEDIEYEYYIKQENKSHLHDVWIPEEALVYLAKKKLHGFKIRIERGTAIQNEEYYKDGVNPDWLQAERIVFERRNEKKEYLVKWTGLQYDEATWEDAALVGEMFPTELEQYQKTLEVIPEIKEYNARPKNFESSTSRKPPFLQGALELFEYQVEGYNWLTYNWFRSNSAILADEMGLGKTVQTVAFIACISQKGWRRPHLIVAPLVTLSNWYREFRIWAPHLNPVVYSGSSKCREMIRDYEFMYPDNGRKGELRCDVIITSYEQILQDEKDTYALRSIQPFQTLTVDEGHRLKSGDSSRVFQVLTQYQTNYRLLLTGTPLQNNLSELFALLSFLDPKKYDEDNIIQKIETNEQLDELHAILKPKILRRTKAQAKLEIPPKKEILVPVPLSLFQKKCYQVILSRNIGVLRGSGKGSLNHIMMELRKCCNHPYLVSDMEPMGMDQQNALQFMIAASGKLTILDSMLTKLVKQGHRTLLFSQFTTTLDILEDYLNAKGWGENFGRIDGSIRGHERQQRIDRFNSGDSKLFLFLISTKAGGLGINLATADTVIIFDSDWNPHNDLQALARAHRIGQKKPVYIYRFVTHNTVEEKIMQKAKEKLALEQAVVKNISDQENKVGAKKKDILEAIKYGALEILQDEKSGDPTVEDAVNAMHFDEKAIDKLLDRSEEIAETPAEPAEKGLFDGYNTAELWKEVSKNDVPKEDINFQASDEFWEAIINERAEKQLMEAINAMGRGKRERKQIIDLKRIKRRRRSKAEVTEAKAKRQQIDFDDDGDGDGDDFESAVEELDANTSEDSFENVTAEENVKDLDILDIMEADPNVTGRTEIVRRKRRKLDSEGKQPQSEQLNQPNRISQPNQPSQISQPTQPSQPIQQNDNHESKSLAEPYDVVKSDLSMIQQPRSQSHISMHDNYFRPNGDMLLKPFKPTNMMKTSITTTKTDDMPAANALTAGKSRNKMADLAIGNYSEMSPNVAREYHEISMLLERETEAISRRHRERRNLPPQPSRSTITNGQYVIIPEQTTLNTAPRSSTNDPTIIKGRNMIFPAQKTLSTAPRSNANDPTIMNERNVIIPAQKTVNTAPKNNAGDPKIMNGQNVIIPEQKVLYTALRSNTDDPKILFVGNQNQIPKRENSESDVAPRTGQPVTFKVPTPVPAPDQRNPALVRFDLQAYKRRKEPNCAFFSLVEKQMTFTADVNGDNCFGIHISTRVKIQSVLLRYGFLELSDERMKSTNELHPSVLGLYLSKLHKGLQEPYAEVPYFQNGLPRDCCMVRCYHDQMVLSLMFFTRAKKKINEVKTNGWSLKYPEIQKQWLLAQQGRDNTKYGKWNRCKHDLLLLLSVIEHGWGQYDLILRDNVRIAFPPNVLVAHSDGKVVTFPNGESIPTQQFLPHLKKVIDDRLELLTVALFKD